MTREQHTHSENDPAVLKAISNGIGTLTMNRGQRMNLMTLEMIEALEEGLRTFGEDPAVNVIVLASTGRAFCAGHDMKSMLGGKPDEVQALFDRCVVMMESIRLNPKPVIAQVQGVAVAAGCQLATSCDLVMASSEAVFGTTGIRSGLFCSTPMVPLSRVVPEKKALELLLTGETITAEAALAAGMVNHVVPVDQLEAETTGLAAKIAAHSPYALRLGKEAFYRQLHLDFPEAYQIGKSAMVKNVLAEDGQEGIASFVEKRPPNWKG